MNLHRLQRVALPALLLFASACSANKMAPAAVAPSHAGVAAPTADGSEMAPAQPGQAPMPTPPPSQPPAPGRAPSPAAPGAPGSLAGPPKPAAGAPASANAKAGDAATRAAEEAMLIYTGALQMQTDDGAIAPTIDRVIDVAEAVGGRVTGRTDASVVVSVPSARFREAMTKMEPLGTITSRSVSAQDVTEQYHDAEVRLLNLRATRQRLQELLAKAGTIADTLTVERELERVAQEIDVLEGKMRFLKERAAFSQITVQLTTKPKAPIVKDPPPPPPPPQRLLDLPVEWFGKLGINRLLDLR